MTDNQSRQLWVVLLCHFTAALVALGMPPFFGLILSGTFAIEGAHWVGWFYIVPTACTALVAPFWGMAADRWGRRWSLLRAQWGLALAFLLAGLASEAWVFLMALVLQGLLGGTFAASSAYLSTRMQGGELSHGLNWMQGSARAAMVLAPILFGVLISKLPPQDIYLYLAVLPVLAALLLSYATPADKPGVTNLPPDATIEPPLPLSPSPEWPRLWGLQFAFNFAMVATFPYFIPWVQKAAGVGVTAAGALFSLPHLVYLLALWTPLGRVIRSARRGGLAAGFLIMAVSFAGQAWSVSPPGMTGWRLMMGLGMTLSFFALHGCIASLAQTHSAGRTFGALDSVGKWAGVTAGLAAGLLSGPAGLAAPLWLGAMVLLVALPGIQTLREPAVPQADTPST